MTEYNLPKAARELGKGMFELAGAVNRGDLDCAKKEGVIFFPEESVLEYKLKKTNRGTGEDFRKLAFLYRDDAEELGQLIELAVDKQEYSWLFIPELEEFDPVSRLMEQGEYEFLCDYVKNDEKYEEKYEVIAARFVENRPKQAALYGIEQEELDLVVKSLERIRDVRDLIDIYQEVGRLKPELAGLFYNLNIEAVEEDIEELKEEAKCLGLDIGYILRPRFRERSMTTRKKREILRTAKMLRKKVEKRFGVKLPEKVRLSSPRGSYASIRYRGDFNNAANAFA